MNELAEIIARKFINNKDKIEKYRLIVEFSLLPTFLIDRSGKFLYVNKAIEIVIGE